MSKKKPKLFMCCDNVVLAKERSITLYDSQGSIDLSPRWSNNKAKSLKELKILVAAINSLILIEEDLNEESCF